MNYLILQKNDWGDLLLLTALIKRLGHNGDRVFLYTDQDGQDIFKYSKLCQFVEYKDIKNNHYDILVNYSSDSDCMDITDSLRIEKKFGLGEMNLGIGADLWQRAKAGKYKTNAHIFQLFFGVCNLRWQGEGYNLKYYPKFKTSQTAIGYYFNNSQLKNIVKNHIRYSPLIKIPKMESICDQIDEVNPCRQVVTDDIDIAQMTIALRKWVFFTNNKKLNYNLQFFGCGKQITLNY